MQGHAKTLALENLGKIIGDLSIWRIDDFIRDLEKRKAKGRILPFVRGLRFSALLIYEIRTALSSKNLCVNWGHILDDDGELVSNEADIIVHKPGYIHQWNGNQHPVMDFKFIEKENAILVISCKSFLRTSEIEIEYLENMKKFVDKIWLFAEACGPESAANIETESKNIGYENFYYLYTWSPKTEIQNNPDGWLKFLQDLKKL